jgi:hypothetical protein
LTQRVTTERVARTLTAEVIRLAVIIIAVLPSLALAQPLPQPKPMGPGGSCPFCVPRKGAQDAIPLPPNGTGPHGWTRSGSYCLRSGSLY